MHVDYRIPSIFLGKSRNIRDDCRMGFLVAGLLEIVATSETKAEKPKKGPLRVVVDVLQHLGHGNELGMTGWALGSTCHPAVLGLVALFDHPLAGPMALSVFEFDDADGVNHWYSVPEYAVPPLFLMSQLMQAVRVRHADSDGGGLDHALCLMHDFPGGRHVSRQAISRLAEHHELHDALLALLTSEPHARSEGVMLRLLRLLHDGIGCGYKVEIQDALVARWMEHIVRVMRRHSQLPACDALGQEDTVLFAGIDAIRILAEQVYWGRMVVNERGQQFSHVAAANRSLPNAVSVICGALPELAFDDEGERDPPMGVAGALYTLGYLAGSSQIGRCRGLPAAILNAIKDCDRNSNTTHDSAGTKLVDFVWASGLEVLSRMALHGGAAEVAEAGALPLVAEALSRPHQRRAWEEAVTLASVLLTTITNWHGASVTSFLGTPASGCLRATCHLRNSVQPRRELRPRRPGMQPVVYET
jgi:hypothetical protein